MQNADGTMSEPRQSPPEPRETGEEVLASAEAREMVGYARGGISVNEISKQFSVCPSTTDYVLSGEAWPHVGGPIRKRRSERSKRGE